MTKRRRTPATPTRKRKAEEETGERNELTPRRSIRARISSEGAQSTKRDSSKPSGGKSDIEDKGDKAFVNELKPNGWMWKYGSLGQYVFYYPPYNKAVEGVTKFTTCEALGKKVEEVGTKCIIKNASEAAAEEKEEEDASHEQSTSTNESYKDDVPKINEATDALSPTQVGKTLWEKLDSIESRIWQTPKDAFNNVWALFNQNFRQSSHQTK